MLTKPLVSLNDSKQMQRWSLVIEGRESTDDKLETYKTQSTNYQNQKWKRKNKTLCHHMRVKIISKPLKKSINPLPLKEICPYPLDLQKIKQATAAGRRITSTGTKKWVARSHKPSRQKEVELGYCHNPISRVPDSDQSDIILSAVILGLLAMILDFTSRFQALMSFFNWISQSP